jgi:hypothetical protein
MNATKTPRVGGRPKGKTRTEPIQIYLSVEDNQAVRQLAADGGWAISELARLALRRFIKSERGELQPPVASR